MKKIIINTRALIDNNIPPNIIVWLNKRYESVVYSEGFHKSLIINNPNLEYMLVEKGILPMLRSGDTVAGCFGTLIKNNGTIYSGNYGTSISVEYGVSISGDYGTSISGVNGTSKSGIGVYQKH